MRSLAVDPAARGLGLARKLTAEIARIGKQAGIERAYADVSTNNSLMLEALLPKFGATRASDEVIDKLNRFYARRGDAGAGYTVYQLEADELIKRLVRASDAGA